MNEQQNGQPPAVNTSIQPLTADSSARMPQQINIETEAFSEEREATTGAIVLPFRASPITGDSKSVKPSKAEVSVRRVTGDSKRRKKAVKLRGDRQGTPSLPGYEFVRHGAGWKVFRVTYSEPLPGRSWKRKARQYETHLTDKDIKDGKDLLECLKAKFSNK